MMTDINKIVIKIGSNTLSNSEGKINEEFVENLATNVAMLMSLGKEVIIVSSGAKIAGVSAIDNWGMKEDIHYKQALCAIGQVRLMNSYADHLKKHKINVGQILLTNDDFKDENRIHNIQNTLLTLVQERVVPIVNENDTVSVDELKIGDNDTLAAMCATFWKADALVILSDINGLYDKNPSEYEDAKIIYEVTDVDEVMKRIEIGGTNAYGTGGIKTKLEAAKICNDHGIPMILASGQVQDIVMKILYGNAEFTCFKK